MVGVVFTFLKPRCRNTRGINDCFMSYETSLFSLDDLSEGICHGDLFPFALGPEFLSFGFRDSDFNFYFHVMMVV